MWLSTETRVLNTAPATRRASALYWGFVRAGSGMIRHDLLRAIAKKVATTSGQDGLAAGRPEGPPTLAQGPVSKPTGPGEQRG
ncbi:hypothetical protein ACFYOY_38620 [Streptomyces sp. NPDC007875]|uniref:hypothetical protein n=1 Tax=Streptomyces sp. NPDC007875 TaxID=3364783 RepID=UPI0036B3D443